MGKKIHLVTILLSFLELWSHITICAASFDTFQEESSYPITAEKSIFDMIHIRPNPAYVGDHVYFTCDFFQSTNTRGDIIKELKWMKNGESIFNYYADISYQGPVSGYKDKIREYNMTDYHTYMWMVVEPSDQAFYQCWLSTNESEVIQSHKVYLTIASSEPCGTHLTDRVSKFTTPLYPNTYPPNAHCVWNIIAPEQSVIKLTFVDFELDDNYPICYGDYVWIWDGKDDKGMYCRGSPDTLYSTSNTMMVIFHSNKWYNFRGFLVEYEFRFRTTPSAETLPSTPELFSQLVYISPNPAYIGNIVTFVCAFYYATGHINEHSIKELHWLKNEELIYSYYANHTHQGPLPGYEEKILYHYMNWGQQAIFMLVDPSDEANFQCLFVTSDSGIRHSKELLTLKTSEPCGTNLTDHAGNFTSPLYPNSYPPNTHCHWNIIAPEEFYIKLTFVDFDVQTRTPICSSYVQIWDGNNDLGIYCGRRITVLYSTSNTMMVIFNSDNREDGFHGFLAEYEFQFQTTP